jgi:hypothetical protein
MDSLLDSLVTTRDRLSLSRNRMMRNGWIRATQRLVARTEIACVGLMVLIAGAPTSLAQLPAGSTFGVPASQQINNPAVSPFLNLAQPGINPGVAYQTLVAPQLQLSNAVALQQQQIGVLQQAVTPGRTSTQQAPGTILATGHPTSFLNTMGYFPQPNLKR